MQTNSPVSKSETWAFRNHFCIKEKTSLCLESINLHFWVYYRLWSQVKCINPLYLCTHSTAPQTSKDWCQLIKLRHEYPIKCIMSSHSRFQYFTVHITNFSCLNDQQHLQMRRFMFSVIRHLHQLRLFLLSHQITKAEQEGENNQLFILWPSTILLAFTDQLYEFNLI